MSSIVRQDGFAGEVSPQFYARTSDPRYGFSLRICKNFLPIQHGALVNRPGTRMLGTARGNTQPRLASFIFSDAQTFVLEFTAGALRFWTNGGQVLNAGAPYEAATPYAAGDLLRLKPAQSGDIITICHFLYQPRDLARLANTNWTLTLDAFGPPAGFVPKTLTIPQRAAANAAAYNAGTLYLPGQYANDGTQTYIALQPTTGNAPAGGAPNWAPALDSTHIAKDWAVVVTALYKDSLGRSLESLPSVAALMTACVTTDRPAQYAWVAPDPPGFSYKLTGYRVYRGRNGLYGWRGDTDAATLTFKDDGNDPNYAIQPPRATNPFIIADGADAANTTKWPGAVTYHEQRRVYARSDAKPNHFFGSRQDDFANFDVNFPVQDTDAYDFGVASQQLEEIRSMLSLNRLLLFTGHAVFAAEGPQGQTLKPTAVQVRRERGEHGASYLQPLAVGNTALYVTAKGNRVRDVLYNWQVNGLDGIDLTEYVRHLFEGHTIVDWCYADEPYKVVWAVRDDGALLSMTYDRASQTWAWARHPTSGQVKAITCVPEGTEDAVYLCVLRNGTYCIERMVSRILPQIADGVDAETGLTKYRDDIRFGVFLDSSVQFDGRNTGVTTMKTTGASFNLGDVVTINASVASFALTDLGDQVVFAPDGQTVLNVDGTVNRKLAPMRATVTQYNSATQVLARLEAPLDPLYQVIPTTAWGWARDTITGLGHLEGETVSALADGIVQGPFVVAGGQVALYPPAVIAQVGLPYDSDLELLDVASNAVKPNVKSVVQAIFEVVASRGISAGQDFDHLRPAKLPKVSDDFGLPALVTDQVVVKTDSTWNTGGRAVLRQSDPLPLTVTAAMREVEVGGRG